MRNKQKEIGVGISKILLFLWFVLLFCVVNLFSQGPDTLWTRTYGGTEGDAGYSVQQTADGGYIIAGGTTSYGVGSCDVYLIKTQANGDTIWTRTYGGTESEMARSVQQTSDGGYIVAGFTLSFGAGNSDVYLIKVDANGYTLWTRTYGGTERDDGYSIQQTSDGGYIVAGYTWSFGAGIWDVYLIKTDANGDTLWTKTYGGTECDGGESVQQTSDGGYIVAGYTYSFSGGDDDVYLIKTDTQGDSLWTKTYGDEEDNYGESVQQTTDGGYIIAGCTHPHGLEVPDVYLIKTDENGDSLWAKTYEYIGYDFGHSVQETSDGGFIVTGSTESGGYYDVYVIKTDTNGDTLWTRTYGGTDSDCGYSVQQTFDDGYIIAGYTCSFGAGAGDVYLVKILPEGAIPQAWISPSLFSVILHPGESKVESLIIGNSGNGILNWSIGENPSVDWLLEDTTSGSIIPEDSICVILTFNTLELSQGVYYDTLVVSSNDGNNPTINIPIQLRIIVSDSIFVYPNPFMPKRGHAILTFANLPEEGTIRVYTISGNLVCKHTFIHTDIFYTWKAKNKDGNDIGSGIYFYLVEDKSGKVIKNGKFAIVR